MWPCTWHAASCEPAWQQIGRYFGGRDHTTVMHACRKTGALLQDRPSDPPGRGTIATEITVINGVFVGTCMDNLWVAGRFFVGDGAVADSRPIGPENSFSYRITGNRSSTVGQQVLQMNGAAAEAELTVLQ